MLKKLRDLCALFIAVAWLIASPAMGQSSVSQGQIEQWRKNGIAYYTGDERFARQNYAKAREFFEKAGAEGDATSIYYLGNMYSEGLGMPADEARAKLYYKRAAELGNPDSQMLTGVFIIMNGIIEHDRTRQYAMYAEANSWLEKAVDQGNMEAAFWLGDMLRKGLGAKRDETRGVALIRQSAKAGNANAQAMLGALYWKGQAGVEKDLMKAHELMNKSILGENQQALALLARIENDMTEEQRKEAQASAKKLAREAKNAPKHTLPVKQ